MTNRVRYRCWYCNREYDSPIEKIRQILKCSCGRQLRVPRKKNGSSKYLSLRERVIEFVAYGVSGALLFGLLGYFLFFRFGGIGIRPGRVIGILDFSLMMGLICGLGGERVVNWIGRILRERENQRW